MEVVRKGALPRGGERAVSHLETLGSPRVSQVLQVAFDTVAGVPTLVPDIHVEC